jgi:diguanylate cyclase (GGDEF)-like protein
VAGSNRPQVLNRDILTILLIEHRGADANLVAQALRSYPDQRFEVLAERDLATAIGKIGESSPDAIVLDADLPDGGLTAVEEIRTAASILPLIVLTGTGNGENAVWAMEAGAQDYILKGELDHAALGRVVLQAIARQRLHLDLEQRLREIEHTHIRLRNIVDLNLDGILVLDRDGRVLFANRAAKELLKQPTGELLGSYLGQPSADIDGTAFTLFDADQRPRRVHMRTYATGWDEEEAYMVLLREPLDSEADTTEGKVTRPDHDPVTGLLNRNAFYRQGGDILQTTGHKGAFAAVLCLNLERFRRVNQALGQTTGDAVLQRVASRLKRELRAGDLLSCFGSDEFLVLLTSLRRPRDAGLVAGKLLDTVALPIEHAQGDLHINARAGISLFPRDSSDVSDLIGHAQIAAERAKRRQPYRVSFYTADLTSQSARRFRLEQGLQKALGNREFSIIYQPIVDARSDDLIATEALLRWKPEPGTVLSASEFVPILEEIGLIDEVGEWVIRSACAEAKKWGDAGYGLPVSVNLSPLQFTSERLPEKIRAALEESGLPAEYLWIEVTESALMQPLEMSINTLGQLREMGVSVCIDDFGTGFSSLAYLKRFAIDTLKVDRSFVQDIVDGAKDAAIARNTIQLAHALELTVVAEGVETAAQLERLREYGCDFYQGHVYSAPLTPQESQELLARNRNSAKSL